ncbi:hypothetical protein SBRCBS47491_003357 [Sporothrix bragantina]|uniref:ABC transporter domain-containing protein n=1 Tax=Sporothrix bragantina TaxID=671064 RepID=A0ABP0BEK4_9PEZI
MVQRLQARLSALIHMSLVGLIHNRCLVMSDAELDESAAVTLMSNDAESVANTGELMHELWSQVLELGIGMYLLAGELGWVLFDEKEGLTPTAISLHLFSPALTLIVYAIQAQLRGAKSIDVEMAFKSLAIVELVASPANTLLSFFPEVASVLAASDRIREYLLGPTRHDARVIPDEQTSYTDDVNIVTMDHVTVRPTTTAEPILRDINTRIKGGQVVVISGGVGTGKTSLVKAILGDLKPEPGGVIKIAIRSIAYCSQTPWLANGTVRQAIRGPLLNNDNDSENDEDDEDDTSNNIHYDDDWYRRVIHACDLEQDFALMPHGDETLVGSQGTALSGGQKQRINYTQALARAVYARRDVVILDDVLSALDATTERHIVENLIGPGGLSKELGTTVVLVTHKRSLGPTNVCFS